jgi:hypothetical protein
MATIAMAYSAVASVVIVDPNDSRRLKNNLSVLMGNTVLKRFYDRKPINPVFELDDAC